MNKYTLSIKDLSSKEMQYNTQQKKNAASRIWAEYSEHGRLCVDHSRSCRASALCQHHYQYNGEYVSPPLRDVPDFKHKLWDHLAIMSGFELDIDYPYEIIRKDNLVTRPDHIPYNTTRMRYRHYGHTLEVLIKKAIEFPRRKRKTQLDCF